jgi:hypothetical protein
MGGLLGQPEYEAPAVPEAPPPPEAPEPPPQKQDADVQQEKRSALERKKYEMGRQKTLLSQTDSGNTRKKSLLGQ